MFNANHFLSRHWYAEHFIGSPDIGGTTTVSTTWVFGGMPFANQSLDYVVKSGTNSIVTFGTATTNVSGVLTINVPAAYSGQKLVVQVENVGIDDATTGKAHGTQVVMVI